MQKAARLDALDDAHEVPDVPAPRVVGVHLPGDAEPLAGRPADHEVGGAAARDVLLADVARVRGVPLEEARCRSRPRSGRCRSPRSAGTRRREAEVEAARARVERDHRPDALAALCGERDELEGLALAGTTWLMMPSAPDEVQ